MLGMRQQEWLQTLLVPWIILFALAAVASAFSVVTKLLFFARKMRRRLLTRQQSFRDPTIKELLDQNEMDTLTIYT